MNPPEDFEDFTTDQLTNWLEAQGCNQDVCKTISDAQVTGRVFLDLNTEDLKDLTDSFLVRKKLRDILKELNNTEEEAVTPCKASARGPCESFISPQTSGTFPATQTSTPVRNISSSPASSNTIPLTLKDEANIAIPRSKILEEHEVHSSCKLDAERKHIVRISMDTLLTALQGRPTETELLSLAKRLAIQYPSLRDDPVQTYRDNYVIYCYGFA